MKLFTLLFSLLLSAAACSAQTSHFVSSGEATIHYKTFGEGAPVLIINGGPGFNSDGFAFIARKIAGLGYQAILFDQRGTGKSEVPQLDSATITMDLMVGDIEAIRQDMGLEEWTVLGHSFGGMLANYYAANHPGRVTAMIQSSSGGIDLSLLREARSDFFQNFTESEIDSLNAWRSIIYSTGDNEVRWKYNQLYAKAYVYHEEHVPVVAERLMEGNLDLNSMVWRNLRGMPFDCKEALSTFCKPVLIIQGEQDVIAKEVAYIAEKAYCQSKVIFLDHCGHYGWLDQEEKYMQEISDFLRQVNG